MSLGPRGHSTKQADAITGKVPVHFIPKLASLLVPIHRSRRTRETDGVSQAPDQRREVDRMQAAAIGQKLFDRLTATHKKRLANPLPASVSVRYFSSSSLVDVPDDADMRAGGAGWAVLGEYPQPACIP